jgi:hypothetical protein
MMQKTTRKLAALASGIVVAVGGLTTGAVTAHAAPRQPAAPNAAAAATCNTNSYSKPAGYNYYPTGFPGGTWLTATYGCGTVWVWPSTNRYVKVCFNYNSGAVCPGAYKYALANTWTLLATGVYGGAQYKLAFQTSGLTNGYYNG